jgi:hypothetical protein
MRKLQVPKSYVEAERPEFTDRKALDVCARKSNRKKGEQTWRQKLQTNSVLSVMVDGLDVGEPFFRLSLSKSRNRSPMEPLCVTFCLHLSR